jgi:predicted nucleic acid-binding protein
MKLIFDSSPLISLGKIGFLEHISLFKDELIIPKFVLEEVVKRGAANKESLYIQDLIKKKLFTIEDSKVVEKFPSPILSQADQQVLNIAKRINGIAVIDDLEARNVAEILNVETTGSAGIIVRLFRKNIISKQQAKEALDQMIADGWYCSTSLYSIIISDLEKP